MDCGRVYGEDGDLRDGTLVEEEFGRMSGGDQGTEICLGVRSREA